MKKLLSPHTILTSIAFIVAFVFPYERVTAAVDASAISRYDNATIKHFTSTIDYVNDYRSHHGRSALLFDTRIQAVAEKRAEEIVRTNMFTHFDENGHTFYKYFTYNSPDHACENLSSSISDDPATPYNGWKKSPPHNECMLDRRMTSYGIASVQVGTENATSHVITVLLLGNYQ